MNKHKGSKIGIKFTEPLVGNYATPEGGYQEELYNNANIKAITASSEYSVTYSADKAFDGNTSSYWRCDDALPAWIQVEFNSPVVLTRFRWYIGNNTYRPSNFTLQGSDDGESFDTLHENLNPSGTGWKDFPLDNTQKYLFYRWVITSKNSTRFYVYEFELFRKHFINESAFKISGTEYRYVNGPLINKTYPIEKAEAHPTENNSILLTFGTFNRFVNVEGVLKIDYDMDKGNLAGSGGIVESFTESFIPQDLVQEPNPGIRETITVAPEIDVDYIPAQYVYRTIEELITVTPSIELIFKEVEIINP